MKMTVNSSATQITVFNDKVAIVENNITTCSKSTDQKEDKPCLI